MLITAVEKYDIPPPLSFFGSFSFTLQSHPRAQSQISSSQLQKPEKSKPTQISLTGFKIHNSNRYPPVKVSTRISQDLYFSVA